MWIFIVCLIIAKNGNIYVCVCVYIYIYMLNTLAVHLNLYKCMKIY